MKLFRRKPPSTASASDPSLSPASSTPARFPPLALDGTVSIGMSAYGNAETTRTALNSLLASVSGDFELILVDDCSPDDGQVRAVFQAARDEHRNTRLFGFAQNHEYSGSLNAILSHASGDWVFFVSNDIFTTPSYFRCLLDVARADPRHGIVRGTSNFVDNALPSHNVDLSGPLESRTEICEFAEHIAASGGAEFEYDHYLTGDAFLVSRRVLDAIGTCDPFFFGYFADHDLGLRAQLAGFELVLACGAFAYHQRQANFDYLPPDVRKRKIELRWARVHENWARFKLKYGLPIELPYTTMNRLPWDQLRRLPFDPKRHRIQPGDYAKYLV